MNPQTVLKELTDISFTDNGKAVAFRFITQNGKSLDVSLPGQALHKLIDDLIQVAQGAAKVRTNDVPMPLSATSPPTTFSGNVVTAFGIGEAILGIGEAIDRKTMFLIVRLHDFDLTFQLERTMLRGLADSLMLAVKTIEADERAQH